MKIIFSDIHGSELNVSPGSVVIDKSSEIHTCVGCFGCWVKTPGKCVIKDGYEDVGAQLSKCDELVLVSRCTYGVTSPFVKNISDRAISYVHPYFETRNGELHHKRRYDNVIKVTAYFYGEDITEAEKETARRFVAANAVNYDGVLGEVKFFKSAEELRGVQL